MRWTSGKLHDGCVSWLLVGCWMRFLSFGGDDDTLSGCDEDSMCCFLSAQDSTWHRVTLTTTKSSGFSFFPCVVKITRLPCRSTEETQC